MASFGSVPLDTNTIPQSTLDIASKRRSNPLPWRGQFTPQLVEALLRTYARPGALVLDPFVGSGTTLLEAVRLRMRAIGCEVNPAAHLLSKLYCVANVPADDRNRAVRNTERSISSLCVWEPDGLFASSSQGRRKILDSLVAARGESRPETLERLLLDTTLVLSDAGSADWTFERLLGAWSTVRATIACLPHSMLPITSLLCDARRLPLETASVDLVLTSPPYINVFNYHQQFRSAVELLGWDVLTAARSEIGSNRKHRANRFLTVTQYFHDMAAVLTELSRVVRSGGRMIIVVGRESTVLGTAIRNGELLLRIATEWVGLSAIKRQERSFVNRFGQTIVEDILHLEPRDSAASSRDELDLARFAHAFLETLRPNVPNKSLGDFEEALAVVPSVHPSPILQGAHLVPPAGI